MSREIIQSVKEEIEITKRTGNPLHPSFYSAYVNAGNKSIFFDLLDNWDSDFATHLPKVFTDPSAAHQCFLEKRDGLNIVEYARRIENPEAAEFFQELRYNAASETSKAIAGLKAQIEKIEREGAQNYAEGVAKVIFRAGQEFIKSDSPILVKHGYELIKEAADYVTYSHEFFGPGPEAGEQAGREIIAGIEQQVAVDQADEGQEEVAPAPAAAAHGGASASAAAADEAQEEVAQEEASSAAVATSASADSSEFVTTRAFAAAADEEDDAHEATPCFTEYTSCLGDSSTADFHGE